MNGINLWHPIKGWGIPADVFHVDADAAESEGFECPGWWMPVHWQRTSAFDPIDGTPRAPVFLGETEAEAKAMLVRMSESSCWNTMTARPIESE